MSTTIDQKVVSLQFDNKQFERNTAQTMSTLDRLKEKLHFTGASKGLENVSEAAKKVDMKGLGGAVETVTAKFSAMQIMATTALVNITNSAVNAGKRMAKALTIEPVMSGFKEYETQINATQTIWSNTKASGTELEDVNKALEELNRYADQTIYNFTEMTNNIGKFTAAGVDLQTSVDSIKGIANLAAVSGSTSQQASTAMYQLSQALAAGKVSLMDWNSVVNAGMGGKLFQDALVRTSELLKTGAKDSIKTYGSFRESLTKGQWLTTEVLTETLKQLSGAYTEADLIAQGFTKEQAAEITALANDAVDAATKVRTFTQLWDVLKESAQSGWAQTWKLLIGDLEDAKALLSPLADTLTGFINKMSDARNRLIEGALNFTKPWSAIVEKLSKAGLGIKNIKKIADAVTVTAEKIAYYQDVVDKVWHGDFNNWGDNPDRRDLLKAAGYDPKIVQYLVNLGEEAHKAGEKYQITADDVAKAHKKYGVELETTAEETVEMTTALNNLSDAQLEKAGLTEGEIALYRDLAKEAELTGKSIDQLAKEMSEVDGKTLLVGSFKNAGSALMDVFGAIKDAWREVFPPMSVVKIYNLIKAFNEFTARIKTFTETHADKLQSAFKGLFSIVKIVTTLFGGAFKIAFKVAAGVIQALGYSIGDIVLTVADAIVRFSDWLLNIIDIDAIVNAIVPVIISAGKAIGDLISSVKDSKAFQTLINFLKKAASATGRWLRDNVELSKIFEAVGKVISKVAKAIGQFITTVKNSKSFQAFVSYAKKAASAAGSWLRENVDLNSVLGFLGRTIVAVAKGVWQFITAIKDSKGFQSFIDLVKKAASALGGWFDGFKDAPNKGKYIIDGLVNGLKNGIPAVAKAILGIASGLIEAFCKFLGIHSPSKTFIEYGKDIVMGLVLGLWEVAKLLFQTLYSLATGALETVKGSGIGGTLVETFTVPLQKIVEFVKGLDLGSVIAIAFGGGALFAIIKIANVIQGFSSAFEGFGDLCKDVGDGVKQVSKAFAANLKAKAWKARASAVLIFAIALGVLVMAIAGLVSLIEKNIGAVIGAVGIIVILAAVLVGVMIALEKFGSAVKPKELAVQVLAFVGIAAAFLILANALQMLAKIPTDNIWTTLGLFAVIFIALGGMMAAMAGLSALGLSDNLYEAGVAILAMSVAMLILTKVVDQISKMKPDQVDKGLKFITGVGAIFAGLVAITKFGGSNAKQAGVMILLMAVAFRLMVNVFDNVNDLDSGAIRKGMNFITGVGAIFAGLVAISKFGGSNASKAGVMILLMAVAFRLMVNVMDAINELDDGAIIKGLSVIYALAGMFATLIATSLLAGKNATKAGAMLLMMAGAMVILTAVIYLIGQMDADEIAKGLVAIGVLSSFMAGLIAVTAFAGTDCTKTLTTLIVAVALLVVAMIGLSFIEPKKLAVASGALALVVGIFALLIYVSKNLEKIKLGKILGPLATLVIVIGLLAFILTMMVRGIGDNADTAIPSAIALGILVIAMTVALNALSKVGKKATKAIKGVVALLAIALPLLAFVGVLALMSNVNVSLKQLAALCILAAVSTLLLTALIPVGQFFTQALKGVIALLVIALPMLAFVGILALLSGIDLAAGKVVMLAALMTVMTILLYLLVPIGALWIPALIGIIGLTAMAIPMLAFIGILALMQYVDGAQANAELLITVMTTMAAILVQIALVGPLALIGVTALTTLMVLMVVMGAFIAIVSGILSVCPDLEKFVDQAIPILVKMAGGLGEMISAFITGLLSGLPEIGLLLSQFMINATPFIMGIKLVNADTLAGAGYLAGAIIALTVADLINGIASFFGCGLPELGTELSQFMINAGPFIDNASKLDATMMAGVSSLADTVLTLTGAGVIEGLTSWLTGGSSLEDFAKELPYLGEGITGLLAALPGGKLTGIDAVSVSLAAAVIKTLAEASEAIPNTGGLLGDLVGNNDMGVFADQFPKLGNGIKEMLEALPAEGFSQVQIDTITAAAEVIKTLAEASKEIPNTGGLLGDLVGNNDMAPFAEQFPIMAKGIVDMLNVLPAEGFTQTQIDTITAAADVVKTLASVADEIPNTGGLLGDLVGNNDMDEFAAQFPFVGRGIMGMLNALPAEGFTQTQIDTLAAAADTVRILAQVASTIPNSGGWVSSLIGDNDMDDFAEQFPVVGKGLKAFNDNIVGINVENIVTGAEVIETIANLTNGLGNTAQLIIFGGHLAEFSAYAIEFFTAIGDIPVETRGAVSSVMSQLTTAQSVIDADNMSADAAAIDALANAMHNVATINSLDANGLRSAIDSLVGANFQTLGEETVKDLTRGMNNLADAAKGKLTSILAGMLTNARDTQDYPGKFTDLGTDLITNLVTAIDDKRSKVSTTLANILSGSLTQLTDKLNYKGKFYDLGSDFIGGFVGGMDAKKYLVTDKGSEIAKALENKIRDELDINSPSKVAYKIGIGVPEGLALGMDKFSYLVTDSAKTMTDGTISSISRSISRISSVVDGEIDAQPTIRPIMDLSDVEAGASRMGALLNNSSSIGVVTNANQISSMMMGYRQNRGNDDLVSELVKLRKDFNAMDRSTYNINGITYDDGSNVHDAVQTLIRAARVGRRT